MYLDVRFLGILGILRRCLQCGAEWSRLLHLHPGEAMKTDIINPEINFDAVQTEFRKKRCRDVLGHLVDNPSRVHYVCGFWNTIELKKRSVT